MAILTLNKLPLQMGLLAYSWLLAHSFFWTQDPWKQHTLGARTEASLWATAAREGRFAGIWMVKLGRHRSRSDISDWLACFLRFTKTLQISLRIVCQITKCGAKGCMRLNSTNVYEGCNLQEQGSLSDRLRSYVRVQSYLVSYCQMPNPCGWSRRWSGVKDQDREASTLMRLLCAIPALEVSLVQVLPWAW